MCSCSDVILDKYYTSTKLVDDHCDIKLSNEDVDSDNYNSNDQQGDAPTIEHSLDHLCIELVANVDINYNDMDNSFDIDIDPFVAIDNILESRL